ncbi:flagellum-specific ATP synthase [Tistlia consotensis]|uniref:Flagellum-specific ATP synthase n=1 Tax=Tistlia consotensis USBA 355 TaxID=560819 RepID=A0A1Y6CJZ1_9PROT|nr:flagellar protein export ATPase FliI [Tistlia consotensis]SMF67365.1 flagellum-specific ATP synthase [Tistlia consotensis USBA 355]SNR99887.1 flagellum-specific ATP synthase [Tistlia consotensis]
MSALLSSFTEEVGQLPDHRLYGRVSGVLGMTVEVAGLDRQLSIGARCQVEARGGRRVTCEVVGFRGGKALLLPFGSLDGVGLGCKAELAASEPAIWPTEAWLGRVVNALGQPVDGKGPLPLGPVAYRIRRDPPPAHGRRRVGGKIDLGVRAINTFLSCCEGQRMGIFAGSGVGKSVLLSQLARYTTVDVNVIGLIGERGREVQEWLEDDLGKEGLARSVVVVATSDEPPLMRRQAAQLTLALAESFRDRGRDVLCLMDSVTRFAMAMREIGLSAGEPPAAKGYTPSVFAELPRLLERAGPGTEGQGSITGLFTVLVEGDDHNEPIADAVRGILDGHIVLERQIAERGRYPAINILRSVSRTLPGCNSDGENALVQRARRLLAIYDDMAELIRIGAYRQGSDASVDEALRYNAALEGFLKQGKHERADLEGGYADLAAILGVAWPPEAVAAAEPPAARAAR